MDLNPHRKFGTRIFGTDRLESPDSSHKDITYIPIPDPDIAAGSSLRPVWRVLFQSMHNSSMRFGIDINGEVILGRGSKAGTFDLGPYGGDSAGVSRSHAMLRPTPTKLYLIDLGSTNGTRRNGIGLGPQTPYTISNGDVITLGRMEFETKIIARPTGYTPLPAKRTDLSYVLVEMAKALTAQLNLTEVLYRALELTTLTTSAEEAAIWLLDEQSGQLALEAVLGIEEDRMDNMKLSPLLKIIDQVMETGQAIRINQGDMGHPLKISTDYLAGGLLFVPVSLADKAFGVILAIHRKVHEKFSKQDERTLTNLADFAAIAVHNSRLYDATESALTRSVEDLARLSHGLTHDIKGLLGSITGYAQLIELADDMDEVQQYATKIRVGSDRLLWLITQMLDISALTEGEDQIVTGPTDLTDLCQQALDDMQGTALAKSISLTLATHGTFYALQADHTRLYRSVLNLLDNSLKYSPNHSAIIIDVIYEDTSASIVVRDTGPGIPEEDLASLFGKYFRGKGAYSLEVGAGLGLAMVQATARAHGGQVTAHNVDEGGAEFTITLPANLRIEDAAQ